MQGTVGPCLQELEKVIKQANSIKLSATLLKPRHKTVTLELDAVRTGVGGSIGIPKGNGHVVFWDFYPTLKDALEEVYVKHQRIIDIDLGSITVKSQKSPLKGKALKNLCTDALYEFYGIEKPSAEDIAARQKALRKAQRAKQAEQKKSREALLALLTNGEVKKWNHQHAKAAALQPFKSVDLSGRSLPGIKLVDMPGADFSHCDLSGASLKRGDLRNAKFVDSSLRDARLHNARFENADLSGADLRGAKLRQVDLRGARLTGSRLDGARFESCLHDESTDWSGTERPGEGLLWRGKGPDPVWLALVEARKKAEGPVDMETFMQRLNDSIDSSRVRKALAMLKKDAFQLYVDVNDEELIGVVKSQNDPDLVYSCRLHSSGTFSCCTQNLNPCGGLRGALCKHLMVLLIGLANANEMDANTLDDWVQRSLLHKPELDKDTMSAILLKYKGADAGEIDWRPTETVPEDFYAF